MWDPNKENNQNQTWLLQTDVAERLGQPKCSNTIISLSLQREGGEWREGEGKDVSFSPSPQLYLLSYFLSHTYVSTSGVIYIYITIHRKVISK